MNQIQLSSKNAYYNNNKTTYKPKLKSTYFQKDNDVDMETTQRHKNERRNRPRMKGRFFKKDKDGDVIMDATQTRHKSYNQSKKLRHHKRQQYNKQHLLKKLPTDGLKLEVPRSLPPAKPSFLPSEELKEKIFIFLNEYFGIFDTGDRQQLSEAYHEDALFTLTDNCKNKFTESKKNKNMKLKQGRSNVIAALSNLPKVNHNQKFFFVDIMHVSNNLMVFVVDGLFQEINDKNPENGAIRSFKRTFAVCPKGDSFVITSELMVINKPSNEQLKTLEKLTKDESQQQLDLVTKFSAFTGMNQKYSTECLEQNKWNWDQSIEIFQQCKLKGNIPAEAFVA